MNQNSDDCVEFDEFAALAKALADEVGPIVTSLHCTQHHLITLHTTPPHYTAPSTISLHCTQHHLTVGAAQIAGVDPATTPPDNQPQPAEEWTPAHLRPISITTGGEWGSPGSDGEGSPDGNDWIPQQPGMSL